jgi:hypothetical protein
MSRMGRKDDELVQAWWNGRWRLARRDVQLKFRPAQWVVEVREGGPDGDSREWEYNNERNARQMVNRCIETGGDGWRDVTDAYKKQDVTGAEHRSR